MSVTTDYPKVKINILTREQYEQATKVAGEIYVIKDESTVLFKEW